MDLLEKKPQTNQGQQILAAFQQTKTKQLNFNKTWRKPEQPPSPVSKKESAKIMLNSAETSQLLIMHHNIVEWEDHNFVEIKDPGVQDLWTKYHSSLEKIEEELIKRGVDIKKLPKGGEKNEQ